MKRRRKPLPRPKTLPEFFEREEQFWQELLASWEGLPQEAFFQPGACGPEWTIKDTMNHILVWNAANRICAKDLIPFLSMLIEALEGKIFGGAMQLARPPRCCTVSPASVVCRFTLPGKAPGKEALL